MFLFAVELLQIHGSRRVAVDTTVNDPAKLWNASQAAEDSARHFNGGIGMLGIDLRVCDTRDFLDIFMERLWKKGETSKTITVSYIPLEVLFIISRIFLRQKGPDLEYDDDGKNEKPFFSLFTQFCNVSLKKGTSW